MIRIGCFLSFNCMPRVVKESLVEAFGNQNTLTVYVLLDEVWAYSPIHEQVALELRQQIKEELRQEMRQVRDKLASISLPQHNTLGATY
ncbi:hypothetical protein CR513_38348, partial [Mucuna pruriens]